MKEVSLGKLKEYITEPFTDEDMMPLILFRGGTDINRARSLWNFVCALKETEVPNLSQATKLSHQSLDLNHICGLHHPLTKLSIESFVGRIWAANRDIDKYLGIREYIEYLVDGRFGFLLEPISRYSIWSKRKWRYPYKRDIARAESPISKEVKESLKEPMPSFYPFISSKPTDEHELLLTVHNAVPKGLPSSHRDDVCQDLLVAVLDGSIKLENLHDEVPKFIKQAYKNFPTKYRPLSLDAPISKDGDSRLLRDFIADPNAEQEIYDSAESEP